MRKVHVEYTQKSSVWDSISTCTPRRNRLSETRFLRGEHVEIESMRLDLLKVKSSLRDSIFTQSNAHTSWSCLCFLSWACSVQRISDMKSVFELTSYCIIFGLLRAIKSARQYFWSLACHPMQRISDMKSVFELLCCIIFGLLRAIKSASVLYFWSLACHQFHAENIWHEVCFWTLRWPATVLYFWSLLGVPSSPSSLCFCAKLTSYCVVFLVSFGRAIKSVFLCKADQLLCCIFGLLWACHQVFVFEWVMSFWMCKAYKEKSDQHCFGIGHIRVLFLGDWSVIKNSHTTSHTTLRKYFDCLTQLTPSATSITKPLSTTLTKHHTTLINSHTSAAKHCSSHSHTISAVYLLILMSSKGLLLTI